MKLIIFWALVTLSTAHVLYRGQKEIRVNEDRIFIRVPGKIIVIEKPKDDWKSLDITVKDGEDHVIKEVYIGGDKQGEVRKGTSSDKEDEGRKQTSDSDSKEQSERSARFEFRYTQLGNNQMTVLSNIFKKYVGVIQVETFQRLLKEIKTAVDSNKLHPEILTILEGLEVQNSSTSPVNDFESFQNWYSNHLEPQSDDGDSTAKFVRSTDFSTEERLKQIEYQKTIREIQGQLVRDQNSAQQLQFQQQFINQLKQQINSLIFIEQQTNSSTLKLHELNQARVQLQNQELELLKAQINLHEMSKKQFEELIKQEEQLKHSLEDERKRYDKSLGHHFSE